MSKSVSFSSLVSYANGTVTTVNLKTGQITCNGTSYALSDYVEEGGLLS